MHALDVFFIFRGMEGIGVAGVGGIAMAHGLPWAYCSSSKWSDINYGCWAFSRWTHYQNINMLIDVSFFIGGGGITIFESHSFPIFSMHCLYKIDLTFNFSKFNLFPSLLYYYRVFFFLFFSVWTKYSTYVPTFGTSQVTVVVKNIPDNAGDVRRLRFDA